MTDSILKLQKRPTATQLKPEISCFSLHACKHSAELRELLGVVDDAVSGNFNQIELYEIMAVTSFGNALLLIKAGYDSGVTASQYLTDNGFAHLVSDTSEIVSQAVDRRIPVNSYLRHEAIRSSGSPYMMDALEIASSASLGSFQRLIDAVLEGSIGFALVKKLGFTALSKISSKVTIEALTAVSAGTTELTPEGLAIALKKLMYGPTLASNTIQLGMLYGDKAVEVSGPLYGLQMHNYLMTHHPDRSDEYRWGAVRFSAELSTLARLYGRPSVYSKKEDMLALYEASASPEEVLNGTITLEQAMAIRRGIPASVSSGML